MVISYNPITGYPYPSRPLNNVTPFTDRDGDNFQEVLHRLERWVSKDLIDQLNVVLNNADAGWVDEINNLVTSVNSKLSEQAGSVEGRVSGLEADNALMEAELRDTVTKAVQQVISSSIEVSDPVIDGVLSNETSESRKLLETSFVSMKGTDPGNIPVVREVGDNHPSALWEYIHNGGIGYIWHPLVGPATVEGDWIFGFGVDNGRGGAFVVRNKAGGVATKWEQTPTINRDRAWGQAWTQSSMAEVVFGELLNVPTATAPIITLVSYKSDGGELATQRWVASNGKAGYVRARDGRLMWAPDIQVNDGGVFRANGNRINPDSSQVIMQSDALRFASNVSAGNFGHKRIRHTSTMLSFELTAFVTGDQDTVPTEWFAPLQLQYTGSQMRVGFFGATPVARPTVDSAASVATVISALKSLGLFA